MTTEIRAAMLDRVIIALGGDEAPACKNDELSDEVWMDLESEMKRQLGLENLNYLYVENSEDIKTIIDEYKLPIYLQKQVNEFNNKMHKKTAP